jgi:hypothetical protein
VSLNNSSEFSPLALVEWSTGTHQFTLSAILEMPKMNVCTFIVNIAQRGVDLNSTPREVAPQETFRNGKVQIALFKDTLAYAAGNDREYDPALCKFLILPAPGHNNVVGNRRQRHCGATGSADDQLQTARFGKDCPRRRFA